jgi:hypothetical protein
VPPELLAHISSLGWAHILLTGPTPQALRASFRFCPNRNRPYISRCDLNEYVFAKPAAKRLNLIEVDTQRYGISIFDNGNAESGPIGIGGEG